MNIDPQNDLEKSKLEIQRHFKIRTVAFIIVAIILFCSIVPYIFGDAFDETIDEVMDPLEDMDDNFDDLTEEEKLIASPVIATTVLAYGTSAMAVGIIMYLLIILLVWILIVEIIKHIVFYFACHTKKRWLVILYTISIFLFITPTFIVDVFIFLPFMRATELISNKMNEEVLPEGYKLN